MKYNGRLRILEVSTYNIQHLSIHKFRPSPPRDSLRVDSAPPLPPESQDSSKAFKILPESIQNTTQRSKQRHGDLRNYALVNGIKFISDDDDAITNIRETWAGACFFSLPHASDISAMHVHNYVYMYTV
jgi:hypothetical protein